MKTRHQINFRSTENELRFIADAARIAGMSKTDFIFSAATEAAKKIGLDPEKYFVSEETSSPQNTGAGFFSKERGQKVSSGRRKGASPGSGGIDGGASKGRSASRKVKPTDSGKPEV